MKFVYTLLLIIDAWMTTYIHRYVCRYMLCLCVTRVRVFLCNIYSCWKWEELNLIVYYYLSIYLLWLTLSFSIISLVFDIDKFMIPLILYLSIYIYIPYRLILYFPNCYDQVITRFSDLYLVLCQINNYKQCWFN